MHGETVKKKKDIWTSKSSVAVACFLPGRAKDLSASLYIWGMKKQCIEQLINTEGSNAIAKINTCFAVRTTKWLINVNMRSHGNILLLFLLWALQLQSLNVLAFSTYNFQLLRSWMQLVQFFIFSFLMSFLMLSSHLFFGLPNGLFNNGFPFTYFFNHSLFWHLM